MLMTSVYIEITSIYMLAMEHNLLSMSIMYAVIWRFKGKCLNIELNKSFETY